MQTIANYSDAVQCSEVYWCGGQRMCCNSPFEDGIRVLHAAASASWFPFDPLVDARCKSIASHLLMLLHQLQLPYPAVVAVAVVAAATPCIQTAASAAQQLGNSKVFGCHQER